MKLKKILIDGYRNLQHISFEPGESCFIYGENGAGKSNLVDAIYQLAYGKSLFFHQNKHLIQHKKNAFTLYAEIDTKRSRAESIAMSKTLQGKKVAKVNSRLIHKQSQISFIFPVIAITPQSVQCLTGSSQQKRAFINLAMFHVEHEFHSLWKQYSKLLKQRNCLLKQGNNAGVHVWDEQMALAGEKIHQQIKILLLNLQQQLNYFCSKLLGLDNICIVYSPGWQGESLAEKFNNNIQKDKQYGYTTEGIHRYKITYTIDDMDIAKVFSRAQLKLFSFCLYFALITLLTEEQPLLLLDDPLAELDQQNCAKILDLLTELQVQKIMTSSLLAKNLDKNITMFHVEHGAISLLQDRL